MSVPRDSSSVSYATGMLPSERENPVSKTGGRSLTLTMAAPAPDDRLAQALESARTEYRKALATHSEAIEAATMLSQPQGLKLFEESHRQLETATRRFLKALTDYTTI